MTYFALLPQIKKTTSQKDYIASYISDNTQFVTDSNSKFQSIFSNDENARLRIKIVTFFNKFKCGIWNIITSAFNNEYKKKN